MNSIHYLPGLLLGVSCALFGAANEQSHKHCIAKKDLAKICLEIKQVEKELGQLHQSYVPNRSHSSYDNDVLMYNMINPCSYSEAGLKMKLSQRFQESSTYKQLHQQLSNLKAKKESLEKEMEELKAEEIKN